MPLNATTMLAATPAERKALILDELPTGYTPSGINKEERELSKARDYSAIINTFIEDYIRLKIDQDNSLSGGSILLKQNLNAGLDKLFDDFYTEKAMPIFSAREKENVFSMSGADNLIFANKVTRSIANLMGNFWEKISILSPYVINPENEFDNFKIKGVDFIVLNKLTNNLEYIQLKTTRGTLTGGQNGRVGTELSIHNNPVFAAAFDVGSWTFNHATIPRVCGTEFWERIGIDYYQVKPRAMQMIKKIDGLWPSESILEKLMKYGLPTAILVLLLCQLI
jgi:hypothetical protein